VLEEPEGDIETAKTAALPAVDVSLVSHATLKYAGTAEVQGQEIALETTVGCSEAKRGDRDIFRIVTEQSSMMGAAADTFEVCASTLKPYYRGAKQGGATVRVNFTETAIEGAISMPGQEMPLKSELDAPVFGSDAALDVVLAALPLAPGYKTTLRTFDIMSQAVKVMSLEVTGVESVTVPAGTFDTYKIELKNMDGEPGGGTVFVSSGDKRHKVRSVMKLPPMMGGGTVTEELASIE
jgi:hypothetical protein